MSSGYGGAPPVDSAAVALFDAFCSANTFHSILDAFQQLRDVLELRTAASAGCSSGGGCLMLRQLAAKLTPSWRAQSLLSKLEKRAGNWEYLKGVACSGTRVLIIGAGPCGLRAAIEIALLGGRAIVVEKRDSFSRNNVLHLWPHLIHDLKALGAKKFFGKFCAGSIDHISIRTLQCILLKVALVVGVEVYSGVSFDGLLEPPADQTISKIGWKAKLTPEDSPVSEYIFDVCISADGKRNTLEGFKKKEFRGKLAIAITANFINRNTQAEASVEEISGVSYIFNQKFFKDLNIQAGIDLENIVYYKDETHYFVMTAKKHSLLSKGVLLQDDDEPERLLSKDNVNQMELLNYARDAANISTKNLLPNLEFAHNHYGQPDVAMFDFTSMFASEYASRVIERQGHRLLIGLVGDTLLEPFWPIGSGCARGFLSALDAAWMVRSWASGKMTPLEVIAERESIYQLLSQTTPENLNKVFGQHTIDPSSRYRNVNITYFKPHQVRHLYDGSDVEYINEIVRLSEQKSKRYDYVRDSHNLLKWIQRQLEPYRNIVKVVDLTTSWRNGLALCALIHLFRPELLDVYGLDQGDVVANSQRAFDVAEKELGIAPFMTGEELVNRDTLDKSKMVGYLSQFYDLFRKRSAENESARKEAANKVRASAQQRQRKTEKLKLMHYLESTIDEIENLDSNVRKRNDDVSSYGVPSKRVRDLIAGETFDFPPSFTSNGKKDLGIGAKGSNNVSILAKDLASKFSVEKKTIEEKHLTTAPKIVPPVGKAQLADMCYFCKLRVYIVERYTLRGILFHRNCLRCDYCGAVLRVTSYACQTLDSGELKFYCVQHNGLQQPAKPVSRTAPVVGLGASRDLSEYTKLCLSQTRDTTVKTDGVDGVQVFARDRGALLKNTRERAEYMTESEVEETELEQTRHNLRCNLLRATAYSDSSSSEEELQFSDEEDAIDEGPDVAWQEMVWRSYRRKFAPPSAVPQQPAVEPMVPAEQPISSGTDTETVGGASDADWETDTGTECDDVPDNKKSVPTQNYGIVKIETVSEAPLTQKPPVVPVVKEMPSYAEIMRSRMAFFSAPSQPVRINARIFLGLDPMPKLPSTPMEENVEEETDKLEVQETNGLLNGEHKENEKLAENQDNKTEVDRSRKRHVRREQPERTKRRHKRRKKRPITGQAIATAVVEKKIKKPVLSIEITSSEEDEVNEKESLIIQDKTEVVKSEDGESLERDDERKSLSSGSQPTCVDSMSPKNDDATEQISLDDQDSSPESVEETSNTLQHQIDDGSESELPDELILSDNQSSSEVDGDGNMVDGRTLDSEKLFSEGVDDITDESGSENISVERKSSNDDCFVCVSLEDMQNNESEASASSSCSAEPDNSELASEKDVSAESSESVADESSRNCIPICSATNTNAAGGFTTDAALRRQHSELVCFAVPIPCEVFEVSKSGNMFGDSHLNDLSLADSDQKKFSQEVVCEPMFDEPRPTDSHQEISSREDEICEDSYHDDLRPADSHQEGFSGDDVVSENANLESEVITVQKPDSEPVSQFCHPDESSPEHKTVEIVDLRESKSENYNLKNDGLAESGLETVVLDEIQLVGEVGSLQNGDLLNSNPEEGVNLVAVGCSNGKEKATIEEVECTESFADLQKASLDSDLQTSNPVKEVNLEAVDSKESFADLQKTSFNDDDLLKSKPVENVNLEAVDSSETFADLQKVRVNENDLQTPKPEGGVNIDDTSTDLGLTSLTDDNLKKCNQEEYVNLNNVGPTGELKLGDTFSGVSDLIEAKLQEVSPVDLEDFITKVEIDLSPSKFESSMPGSEHCKKINSLDTDNSQINPECCLEESLTLTNTGGLENRTTVEVIELVSQLEHHSGGIDCVLASPADSLVVSNDEQMCEEKVDEVTGSPDHVPALSASLACNGNEPSTQVIVKTDLLLPVDTCLPETAPDMDYMLKKRPERETIPSASGRLSHRSSRSDSARPKRKTHKKPHREARVRGLTKVVVPCIERRAPKAEVDSFSDDDLQVRSSETMAVKADFSPADLRQTGDTVRLNDDRRYMVKIDHVTNGEHDTSTNVTDCSNTTSMSAAVLNVTGENVKSGLYDDANESNTAVLHIAKAAGALLDQLVGSSLEETCQPVSLELSPNRDLNQSDYSLPLDPVARIDLLLDSLSSSKLDFFTESPSATCSPQISMHNRKKKGCQDSCSFSSDDASEKLSSRIGITKAGESATECSYSVVEKHKSCPQNEDEVTNWSSDASIAAQEQCVKPNQQLIDRSSLNDSPQNICSSALEETTATNDDSESLDCIPSLSFDDSLSLENVIDDNNPDLQELQPDLNLCNGDHSEQLKLKVFSESESDRLKSLEVARGSYSVALVSPHRIIDAKRRFFGETPQVLRIDPRRVFNDIPSAGARAGDVAVDRNGNCIDGNSRSTPSTETEVGSLGTVSSASNDIKGDTSKRRVLPSVPTTNQLPSGGIPHEITSEELSLLQAVELNYKTALPDLGPSLTVSDEAPLTQPKLEKLDKKRPSTALSETCDPPATSRLSPLQAKAQRIVSAALSKSPLDRHRETFSASVPSKSGDVSPSQMRLEGPSWGFGRQKSKPKDQTVGIESATTSGQKEASVPTADKKDKRRSLLSMLMPSKGLSDKRDKASKEFQSIIVPSIDPLSVETDQPDIVASREKTKSLPNDQKRLSGHSTSTSDESKQTGVEKRRSKASKLKGGKKVAVDNLNVEGQTTVSIRTVYEEMAPIMEGIKHVERRNREKASIHERIQAVAPPPLKAPNTALLPPKAAIEDFETESEIGDDRISLRSFQSQCHLPNDDEESLARHRRRQQKVALRKQREKELCRLHVAQEIQRQLQEVEQRQRDVEHRGIIIEKLLRGESADPSLRSTSALNDESALMQEWFDVVHEKNVLMSYESELAIHGRELELEDRQSRLETQLRDRIPLTEVERLPSLPDDEQRILQELVEVVQQRDALVALLEEERLKQQQYDRNLEKIMVERGFVMSSVSYLQQLRQPLAAMRGDVT